MAETKINVLRTFALDSPSQVIPSSVTFTLSSKTVNGGYGRIGGGYAQTALVTFAVIPAVPQITANTGFIV